ncbi:hypothetical protein [Flavobacterium sp. CF136]|uniref:hypothetical protein n=1 Tax=Flavobacterium sp. (strain CF136) TaxID=1144313 RepID=UPI000271C9AD|nr:hypothetical protein [Flavobacterium sp. CF136]EJL64497.1 hypothetical protein PMI10_01914 [Flavobacterium sp. CF136]
MKIMYHVALDWSDAQIKIMNEFGIYPVKGHTAVQMGEETYFKVKDYIYKWAGSDGIRYPEFTKQEIKESLLSVKKTAFSHGYPMPDMDFGYKELTYDLSDYCPSCGIGFKQKDAFRLKNVPPAGKKQIFSLGWVFDELFVEKTVYEEIFKPLGIKCREVLKYKKDTPFENTVQLVLEETQEKLNLEGYPTEICNVCERTKYLAMPQGFYPMPKDIIAPIFKSHEYFGSGALAFKRIFVEKELREKLVKSKIDKEDWYIPTK